MFCNQLDAIFKVNKGNIEAITIIIEQIIVIVTVVVQWNSRITHLNAFACIDSQPGSMLANAFFLYHHYH